MKCLNQECSEEVTSGNYCPRHALSAGSVWKNIEDHYSEANSQLNWADAAPRPLDQAAELDRNDDGDGGY